MKSIARVIVEVEPFHLDRPFDYLIPDDMPVTVGSRVQVVFSGRRVRGLVVEVANDTSVATGRLRAISRTLGDFPWVDDDMLDVLRWAAQRFGAPLADVVRHALPARTVDVERRANAAGWFPASEVDTTSNDLTAPPSDRAMAIGDARVQALDGWAAYADAGRSVVEAIGRHRLLGVWRPLPDEELGERLAELVELTHLQHRGVVVVVPDPASPVAEHLLARFAASAIDLRSTVSPRKRYEGWLRARCSQSRIVIGERAAAFAPVARLGLAVIVNEASPAHKERRSPRHHAREVVLERARRAEAVGLAITTVPSATTWRLLAQQRLIAVTAPRQREREHRPPIQVVDFSRQARTRISREAVAALRAATRAGEYAVVLSSRAGAGRVLLCVDCRRIRECRQCAASVSHSATSGLQCGRCGQTEARIPACPTCGGTAVVALAAGTQQLAADVRRVVNVPVAVMEGYAADAPAPPAVLVMTRGSVLDIPPGRIGAAVVADFDALLSRPALDAAEDALRLAAQLGSWIAQSRKHAHTGSPPVPSSTRQEPQLIVQTTDPEHHAVEALQRWLPGLFWQREAALRQPLRFPPAADIIKITVQANPAPTGQAPTSQEIFEALQACVPDGDELLGPLYDEQTAVGLIKTDDRQATLAGLAGLRAHYSRQAIDIRVDVDPVGT